jgi:hypothetical protein
MFLLLILSVLLIFLIYKWGTSTFDYFEKREIPYLKPTFFFGNAAYILTRKFSFPDIIKSRYFALKNEK